MKNVLKVMLMFGALFAANRAKAGDLTQPWGASKTPVKV